MGEGAGDGPDVKESQVALELELPPLDVLTGFISDAENV